MFTGITFDFIIGLISSVFKPEEHMEKQINEKMPEIIYKVNDMILVEWSVFTIKVDEITKPL